MDVKHGNYYRLLQQHRPQLESLLTLALAVVVLAPLTAHAQDISPVTGTMTAIHGFLQSTAIRTLAAIAVIGVGITAMMGRMRWAWAGSVIGGIVLIFGADQFVSFFTASAGG
jgi:type IV secretion system protein VirB2